MTTENNQLLYFQNPEVLEFEARIVSQQVLPDGRWAVQLDRSYFYPTGGGQEHDTGKIGEAQVIEVFKQGDPIQVIHVIDQPLQLGPIIAEIDSERRLRHMQHHTAQHLLTQCFIQVCDLETLSANINGFTPSTIDLPNTSLEADILTRAENLANQMIYEDRLVKSYFVTANELAKLPVRRIPPVQGAVRVIEIDGFDFTLCGGTHCRSTGQIGVMKIVRLENQKDRLRVHFVAGLQALQLFQSSYAIVSSLAASLSVGQDELIAAVKRQSEQFLKMQKEINTLQIERLGWEAEHLAQAVEIIHDQPICLKIYAHRSMNDLRMIASRLAEYERFLSVLVSTEGKKISIVVATGKLAKLPANKVLQKLLELFNGRGGGDTRLAQGGGTWSETQDIKNLLYQELKSSLSSP